MAPHLRGLPAGHPRDERKGGAAAISIPWLGPFEPFPSPNGQKPKAQEGHSVLLVPLLSWAVLAANLVVMALLVCQGRVLARQLAAKNGPGAAAPCLRSSRPARYGNFYGSCHQVLRDGRCVDEVLREYHLAHAHRWPAQVDLIVRTHHSPSMFLLLSAMLRSVELFWPIGIAGDVVVVLDDSPDDRLYAHTLPSWCKVLFTAAFPEALPGYLVQQHSLFWSDNYTSAPFLAIADDDMVFTTPVTPELLFDSNGRPFAIASSSLQRQKEFRRPTEYFLGAGGYRVNAMVALPNVYPTAALPALRRHVVRLHGAAFDDVFVAYCTHKRAETQIGQFLMGNYLYHNWQDKMHFVLMESEDTPLPRVAEHVTYSMELVWRIGGGFRPRSDKFRAEYLAAANACVQRGLCSAFPPGELGGGCEEPDLMAPGPWSYYIWLHYWTAFGTTMAVADMRKLRPPPPAGSLPNIPFATERLRRHVCGLWELYSQGRNGSITPGAGPEIGAGNVNCNASALIRLSP